MSQIAIKSIGHFIPNSLARGDQNLIYYTAIKTGFHFLLMKQCKFKWEGKKKKNYTRTLEINSMERKMNSYQTTQHRCGLDEGLFSKYQRDHSNIVYETCSDAFIIWIYFTYWGLRSTGSPPSWTQLGLITLCRALGLCHSWKGCALPPSCLKTPSLLSSLSFHTSAQ